MRERILVREANWVGDVVMTLPALAGIRKNFPDSKISVLIKPPLLELLEENPAVDEIILYDSKGADSGPAGIGRVVRELRSREFHRAILFQNAFEAAFLSFLAKIPRRMGYATDGRGILLTDAVKVKKETRSKHQVYYYTDLLEGLGLKTDGLTPKLYLKPGDKEYASSVLKEKGIPSGGLIIGINPGAQYGIAKKWHPERFGAVADRLVKEFGARIMIFGGHGDMNTARAVQASMREEAVNMAGNTTLRQLMALIKRCGLFITNDSGPMHISAALKVPTLAVFGSTDPVATGPLGKVNRVVREPVTCSPCLKRQCRYRHYQCMERVTAERVFKAAKEMLGQG